MSKSNNINIRVNDETKKILLQKAKGDNISISRYVRRVVTNDINTSFIKSLKIYEAIILSIVTNSESLSNVSSNLNQIAFKLNVSESVEMFDVKKSIKDLLIATKKTKLLNSKLERLFLTSSKKAKYD